MRIINKDFSFDRNEKTVVTVGKFDGLHIGHRRIFELLKKEKEEKKLISLAVSFVNSPQSFISAENSKGQLLTETGKEERLSAFGTDYYCGLTFDRKLMNTSAEDFFSRYIVKKWNAEALIVGDDFRFGKDRSGDAALLEKLCSAAKIRLTVVPRVHFGSEPISSTRIKESLLKGDIENANAMLGYAYFFEGEVKSGNRIGRTIGFPTVNLLPEVGRCVPAYGVYGSYVKIGEEIFSGVTNIGVKPTVSDKPEPVIETNIIDFDSDLYGDTVKVSLIKFIRPEIKFSSMEMLKNQIESDKKYWTNLS